MFQNRSLDFFIDMFVGMNGKLIVLLRVFRVGEPEVEIGSLTKNLDVVDR